MAHWGEKGDINFNILAAAFQTHHDDVPDDPPPSQRPREDFGGGPRAVAPDGDDGGEPHVDGDAHGAALLPQDGEEGQRVAPDLQRQPPTPQRPWIERVLI